MKITVIGAGNAGSTVAADLTHKGHKVTLLKTSNKIHNEHFKHLAKTKNIRVIDLDGTYEVTLFKVTTSFEEALVNAEVIILYVQTNYHEELIEKMIPFLHEGQTIILEPGYMSTCYFLKHNCPNLILIEAESSPIDCRIIEPGIVKVLFKNVMNPFGVYPNEKREDAKIILEKLGYPFEIIKNVVEAALHNPNLIVHTIGAIFSIPRIEYSKGNYWMYREVFTPHIWNVVESLDNEKMDILEAVGCDRIPYVEACKNRNSNEKNVNALEVFFDYALHFSPAGPTVPDSRYITEDVPEGLVMLESLGKVLQIPTPTCSGLINCANAALKRNFRNEGRKVDNLGYENLMKILKDD